MKSRDKQIKSNNSGKKMFRGTARCRIFSKGKRNKGNGQKRLTASLKRERGNSENTLENKLKKRDAIWMKDSNS